MVNNLAGKSGIAIKLIVLELPGQIVSMQSIHYLTLCVLIPPLLTIFADPTALTYEGKGIDYRQAGMN